jgi:hypothetical protein
MQATLANHANYVMTNVNHEFTTRNLWAETPIVSVPARERDIVTDNSDLRQASATARNSVRPAGKNAHQQSAFMLALWRSLSAWGC